MQGKTTASRDRRPLTCSDAVAAIIVMTDGRYLLQHRDDRPGIWYPDHWGCFGGAVEPGEDDIQALARELREELALDLVPAGPVFRMDYTIVGPGVDTGVDTSVDTSVDTGVGTGRFSRNYYEVALTADALDTIRLGEGQGFDVFRGADILDGLRTTPYDAFAIHLHMRWGRLAVRAGG